MNEKNIWRMYKLRNDYRRAYSLIERKIFHTTHSVNLTKAGKLLIPTEQFDDYLRAKIASGQPLMVARYGSVEAGMIFQTLGVRVRAQRKIGHSFYSKLHVNAGFFPNEKSYVDRFVDLMMEASKEIDVLCYWETGGQEYLADFCCGNETQLTALDNLQPFWKKNTPWTAALKGKKVLVIHPFAETIEKQYRKREYIWKNDLILPEFELHTLKAVQTIAGNKDERFEDWFQALDYMYSEAMKKDFDVAVIACGAYGMPLAYRLKMAGKQAIHWGGMSQIWFGIKGSRWDNNPRVNQFYNEYWVRPDPSETPNGKNGVEGGCYW